MSSWRQLGAVSPIRGADVIAAVYVRAWTAYPLPVLGGALFVLKSIQGEVLPTGAGRVSDRPIPAFVRHYLRDIGSVNRTFSLAEHRRDLHRPVALPMGRMAFPRCMPVRRTFGKATRTYPHKLRADADPMKKAPSAGAILAEKVDEVRSRMDRPYFVCSDKIRIASCLAFYLEGNPRTHCVYQKRDGSRPGQGPDLPGINNFDTWEQEDRAAGRLTRRRPGGADAVCHHKAEEDLPSQLCDAFESYEKLPIAKSRDRSGTMTPTFVCRGFKGLKVELPTSY